MHEDASIVGWRIGSVDPDKEHFELRFDIDRGPHWEDWLPIARIGTVCDQIIHVDFLVDADYPHVQRALSAAVGEIEELLLGKGFDAWQYGQYHCGTLSNAYSAVHWRLMSQLDQNVQDFGAAMRSFAGFDKQSFEVKTLRENPDWKWGYEHGVYCFTLAGEVVYVGRALGATLGERVADQLTSLSDPEWEAIVVNESTRLEVFATTAEWGFVTAALEIYLIQRLSPIHNKRVG